MSRNLTLTRQVPRSVAYARLMMAGQTGRKLMADIPDIPTFDGSEEDVFALELTERELFILIVSGAVLTGAVEEIHGKLALFQRGIRPSEVDDLTARLIEVRTPGIRKATRAQQRFPRPEFN